MHPILQQTLEGSRYDQLPESIKAIYTEREYSFLTETQKALIEQTETEPDTEL